MLSDVTPNVERRPAGKGIDFYETKFLIAFDYACSCPCWSLISTNRCDPSAQISKRLKQWLNFTKLAAQIRLSLPQLLTKLLALIFQRKHRGASLKTNSIPNLELISQCICFREEEI